MKTEQLEPIHPEKAREMYLEERKTASYATRRTIQDTLKIFVAWTEADGIENMNTIRGRQLRRFKNWCKDTSDNNTVSLNGIMSVIRRFMVFCVKIEAVYSDVPDKTPVPNVPDDEAVSYEKPSDEHVEATLDFLESVEPSSRRHIEYRLIKEVGNRVGAVRAIDVGDVDIEDQVIRLRHRPEKEYEDERGTPLKNGKDGQRNQNISEGLAELIKEYLDNPKRPDVKDKFGRKPLLTTEDGRPSITTIRRDLYKLTRPCETTGECPHDRDIESCNAKTSRYAFECPSSHSPHPLRRWSIEHQIESGVSKELLADRVDVSVAVLNEHYDTRSEERKRKHRLSVLEKVFPDYGNPDATIDAGVLVDMFVNSDGTVDTKALMDFKKESQDSAPPESETVDAESDVDDTASEMTDSDSEAAPEGQMTMDRFSDSTTGVLHPGLVPILVLFTANRLVVTRLSGEFQALASRPGTSLRPSGERVAKGAAAYSLFVAMLTFNLMSLNLVPLGLI